MFFFFFSSLLSVTEKIIDLNITLLSNISIYPFPSLNRHWMLALDSRISLGGLYHPYTCGQDFIYRHHGNECHWLEWFLWTVLCLSKNDCTACIFNSKKKQKQNLVPKLFWVLWNQPTGKIIHTRSKICMHPFRLLIQWGCWKFQNVF